ncbi:protease complex subunit PrcB family protein [Tumebacillus sp. ITR2]|uniref:Protease complex subunit PrcB family protein n=1 Tax=Tumebacillus amylolyticus TaxID=2801339 RepID=A0ABS1JAU0_9BACL|nr:protease complex subunit PrcB family protein [Tumebacillus amylolyticus]MBL0386728.1 protease complex subunit PrcB family protein [Tumebacillus amylolyticus]
MATTNEKVTRIEFMEELNQIGLSPNVTGAPADTLSRAEAAVFLAEALPPLNTGFAGGQPAPFRDLNSLTTGQQQAVSTLYSLGIVLGDGNGLFHGNQDLTRDELGMIVERTQARLQAAGASTSTTNPTKPTGIIRPTSPSTEPASSYQVITDLSALPQDVQNTALAVQGTSGAVSLDSGDSTYLLISAGERNTGGYAVTVDSVNETDTRIEVTVGLTTPAAGTMSLQAITYPQTVVEFAQTVKPIVVLNQEVLSA